MKFCKACDQEKSEEDFNKDLEALSWKKLISVKCAAPIAIEEKRQNNKGIISTSTLD